MNQASNLLAQPKSRDKTLLLLWGGCLTLGVLLYYFSAQLPEQLVWLIKYPKNWVIPLKYWISDFMKWLIEDLDFGLFTFKEFTRSITWLLEWPLRFASALLTEGFTFSSDPNAPILLQRLPWVAVTAIFTLIAYRVNGWKLAILVGSCFLYLALFGRWESAMVTLSSIVIAVPFGVFIGMLFGILCFRHRQFETILMPVLDLMQTVPVFAYLVPVLFLFGFGPVAAMIATMIYATPPMVRLTLLALKQVPAELVEYGKMAGCTNRQLLWKVQIPGARAGIMVGGKPGYNALTQYGYHRLDDRRWRAWL